MRKRLHGNQCVYCGLSATDQDHFPPKSLTLLGWLLPACGECNVFAGTFWGLDFVERARTVKDKIRQKHAKTLRTPDWSVEEKEELGHNLLSMIVPQQFKREILLERLAWSPLAYIAAIDVRGEFAEWCESKESQHWRSLQEQSPN